MEPRKASDILLDMESKVEILLNLVRTQDLNIKILSNKINELNEKYKQLTVQSVAPAKIEVVETPHSTAISSEVVMSQEVAPKGFRRTSRPETYSGDDKYLSSSVDAVVIPKFPTQIPKMPAQLPESEVVVPVKNITKPVVEFTEIPEKKLVDANNVPVVQRVVNKTGKSVFLADIEIIDLSTMNSMSKTRTNGTGKWMASLPIGKYRIFIRKRESINKDILEVSQDITVDGSQSPFELKTIIIQ